MPFAVLMENTAALLAPSNILFLIIIPVPSIKPTSAPLREACNILSLTDLCSKSEPITACMARYIIVPTHYRYNIRDILLQ